MKISNLITTLPYFIHEITAHGVFAHLIVNGTITPRWKYVRNVAEAPGWSEQAKADNPPEAAKRDPFFDIFSPNMICGREAEKAAKKTETATVIAGSEVGFRIAKIISERDNIFHDGPGQAYLARAPNGNLEEFNGKEGDWFKISYAGPKTDTSWKLRNLDSWNFSIPLATPPGKYLLRWEMFQPYSMYNTSQWYVNCAHVNIVGNGAGHPIDFVKFPGAYDIEHPGIHIPQSMDFAFSYPGVTQGGLLKYIAPGPAVWAG
ncbi:lytic polysaccharide monooxygenase [Amniculicola lignicola CBS 123094]|uniref:lytic cellulose monooxygenase (C4-dehydrogenating) n=1 Tax=Amniculicola lignicola CBS 123094 TaxID=1392246 RepID=A0A6A5VX78_9PLEO|nr:lytic polysaccharide monooxygenase [Amniculicola lignicola CBS 123094]